MNVICYIVLMKKHNTKGANEMKKIYEKFFRKLLANAEHLASYVDSLYSGNKFSENDLNHIFGILKSEGLITCVYADNRAWVHDITFKGKHYFDEEVQERENKPRLIDLIDQTNEIEKLFHMVGGKGIPEVSQIYDIQEFQDWIQELQYELQELLNTCEEDYVRETLEMVSKKFNGWNDRKDFSIIKGKLKVIKRNRDKYFFDRETKILGEKMEMKKNPLIFISHSSENKEQVRLFVELLSAINLVPKRDIFCSSLPGYDIPIDTDIFEFLKNQFLDHNLHMIFIHSEEYYNSPVSLNEMGAAWVLKSTSTSVLVPGFEFDSMRGVINADKIAIKLDSDVNEVKDKLNQLRKTLEREFNLTTVPDITWEQARDKFIEDVNHPKAQELQLKNSNGKALALMKKVAATSDGVILILQDLEVGMSIQIGQEVIVSERPNRREFAEWDAALRECLNNKLIEKRNENVYVITNAGYNLVDEN